MNMNELIFMIAYFQKRVSNLYFKRSFHRCFPIGWLIYLFERLLPYLGEERKILIPDWLIQSLLLFFVQIFFPPWESTFSLCGKIVSVGEKFCKMHRPRMREQVDEDAETQDPFNCFEE